MHNSLEFTPCVAFGKSLVMGVGKMIRHLITLEGYCSLCNQWRGEDKKPHFPVR